MIVSSRATLSMYSDTLTVTDITERVGLEPHDSHEKGERRVVASGKGRPYERAYWSYGVDTTNNTPEDETGTRALRLLLDVLEPAIDRIASLRSDCDLIVWWSGDSDSTQGGFVLPAELLTDLVRLKADLYGTTYLDSGEGDT